MAANPLTAEMKTALSRKQLTFRPVDLIRFLLPLFLVRQPTHRWRQLRSVPTWLPALHERDEKAREANGE